MHPTRFCAFLVILTLFGGCASLKSIVENDPINNSPSGPNVFMSVWSVNKNERNDIGETILGRTILAEASTWLNGKGFIIVNEAKKANSHLMLSVASETKEIYVPAQTYSVPVYGDSGSTTEIKNAYGQKIGSLESKPTNSWAPTGYQTEYREGYRANVTDRWLFIAVWRHERGRAPMSVTNGQIYPENRDQEFFENRKILAQAVGKLLTASVFGNVQRAPAALSTEDPGCWYRLGLVFDEKDTFERGAKIKGFSPSSRAKSVLKVGDVIYSINDQDVTGKKQFTLKGDEPVLVVGTRGSNSISVKAHPTMQCLD